MRQLEAEGPFVLPSINCSDRLADFLRRGNTILGFYFTVAMYSEHGRKAIESQEAKGVLKPDTLIRKKIEPGGIETRLSYGLLKRQFQQAGARLTNQTFLMVYGNFEAYMLDAIADGFRALSCATPEEEAIKLMIGTSWRGKFDRIAQKIGVSLGKGKLVSKFRDLDMGFLGDKCTDPIDFLDRMADLRHRLVHSNGRADTALLSKYPNTGLSAGDLITLPFGLPHGIHMFFVFLGEVVDESFAIKFNWTRSVISPERLVD